MLTLDKLNIYRRFDGDLDGWARTANGTTPRASRTTTGI